MMMKGPIREVIPVTSQQLTIRIPGSRRVSNVRLLVAGTPARYRQESNTIHLTVPTIGVHEVVALDFAS